MRHRRARRTNLFSLGPRPRAWVSALRRISIQPRDRKAALVLVVALMVASTSALILGAGSSGRRTAALPPTPPSPAATAIGRPPASSSASGLPKAVAAPFRCATEHSASGGGGQPVQLCIPSLRVDTSVMQLGLNSDGTVEVPPLSRVRDAGWYRYSATPGAVGPTVILGHVDSAQYGQGVFFHLASLHPGNQIELRRSDGKIAVYRVDTVVEVPKSRFPTDQVYGATSGPAIRLVTCGGKFDAGTGNYLDNIIAYGTLLRVATT